MKCGRTVCFHGAFKSKSKAVRKERKVGGFIRKCKIKGHARECVFTKK